MPRFLRIQNNMVHVPSLSSVSMGTTCFGYPNIHISYHTRQELYVTYGSWEDCERDFNRVKSALKEVEGCLEKIVLTEEPILTVLEKDHEELSAKVQEQMKKVDELQKEINVAVNQALDSTEK